MIFAPFNLAARSAFLQSGSLAGLSLTQLEALSGTLILTVAGVVETSAAIDLSTAGSFSGAATLIQAGFTTPPFTVAWNPVTSAFVITTTATGATETITFASGTLAAGLNLTQATGAILSQGAALDTPATAMANAVRVTQNFASVVTLWEPTLSDKEGFAAWFNAANMAYLYLGWDSDPNASVQGNTTSFGAVAKAAQYNGVACISGDPALALASGTTLAALYVRGRRDCIDQLRRNQRARYARLPRSVGDGSHGCRRSDLSELARERLQLLRIVCDCKPGLRILQ
jgi:hypothetical protein